MTQALKRAFAIGLLSYVFAFATMFTMISAIYPNGTDDIVSFLLTGLVAAYLMYRGTIAEQEQVRKRLSVGSVVVLLIGFATMFFLTPLANSITWVMIGCFAALGFLFLRRMTRMIDDLKYLRYTLVDQYKQDLLVLVGLAILVLLVGRPDPAWTGKVLPFFVCFLVARLLALSLASQLNKDNSRKKTIIEKWQDRMPFLLVGGALLLTWLLLTVGGSLWRLIVWLLTPLWYALGWIAQGLYQLLSHSKFPALLGKYLAKKQSDKSIPQTDLPPILTTHNIDWLWFKILIVLLFVGAIAWYTYKVIIRTARPRLQAGAVEIREFLPFSKTKAAVRRGIFHGPLTPMRKTYRKFLFEMQKRGFVRRESETAGELVGKIAAVTPKWGPDMYELTETYMRERYGGQKMDDKVPRAEQLVQGLTGQQENK